MNVFDEILLNILVLSIPIVLYHLTWHESPDSFRFKGSAPYVISIVCSVSALFCMSHPLFIVSGTAFDLRTLPILVAFLYSGVRSGLAVYLVILGYAYVMDGLHFLWFASLAALLVPFILSFISLSNWKQVTPKIMFPSLLALASAFAYSCMLVLYRMSMDLPIPHTFIYYTLLYILVQTVSMGILSYFIVRIQENIALRHEVHKSEKLNVLSELAASVAHEIRNPMTVARGFMQMLSQSQVSEDKKRIYTHMVIEEIDRAQSIISDYLSFAKPEAEKMEELDLSTLAHKISNLITPYAAMRGIEIVFDIQADLRIKANSDKITQCLINLTKNGIEAMPDGGHLHIAGYRKDHSIILQIKDTGVGMSEEQVQRLGTPFYSTKNKGTGLGLMVSYRIIKNFGGKIDVHSQENLGTCFTISLPAV
ncbi:ATP-binding protein [Paenibacillus ferrarius]|uniref:ATP-binding protein n=1 Tax=Paenibacillus ferrarius TaxID=1469647 RepID=UPI003D2AE70B